MEKALSASLTPTNYLKSRVPDGQSLVKPSKEFEQNYVVYRIGLKPVEIDKKVRDTILEFMNQGKKFIQVDDYTIMLNSISSIEPIPIKKKPKTGKIINNIWVEDQN